MYTWHTTNNTHCTHCCPRWEWWFVRGGTHSSLTPPLTAAPAISKNHPNWPSNLRPYYPNIFPYIIPLSRPDQRMSVSDTYLSNQSLSPLSLNPLSLHVGVITPVITARRVFSERAVHLIILILYVSMSHISHRCTGPTSRSGTPSRLSLPPRATVFSHRSRHTGTCPP